MKPNRLPRPSAAMLVAVVALFSSLAGGATAATVISGKQIKNSSITSTDIKNKSLLAKDFKAGQLKAGKAGKQGPQGPRGATGATGAQGATGQRGPAGSARAYGIVTAAGALERGKGATVRRPIDPNNSQPYPGHYCLTVPGASTADDVVIVDTLAENTYFGGAPGAVGDTPIAVFNQSGGLCEVGEFEVITGLTESNNGVAQDQPQEDASFSFMVP